MEYFSLVLPRFDFRAPKGRPTKAQANGLGIGNYWRATGLNLMSAMSGTERWVP